MSFGCPEWSCVFDPCTHLGTVHRFPQVAPPLHVQPKIPTVAEHASEHQRRRRRHVPAVLAKLVDVLALHADSLGQAARRRVGKAYSPNPSLRPNDQSTSPPGMATPEMWRPRCCSSAGRHGTRLNPRPSSIIANRPLDSWVKPTSWPLT